VAHCTQVRSSGWSSPKHPYNESPNYNRGDKRGIREGGGGVIYIYIYVYIESDGKWMGWRERIMVVQHDDDDGGND